MSAPMQIPPPPPMPVDTITAALCLGDAMASKAWRLDAQGRPEKVAYSAGEHFMLGAYEPSGIRQLSALLIELARDPKIFVMRGAVLPHVDRTKPTYRRKRDRPGEPATLAPAPRRWVMLDLDDAPEPYPGAFRHDPAACVRALIGQLPSWFHGVTAHWHASASAGFAPGIRCHLWFWCDRPVSDEEWARLASTFAIKVDTSLFDPVQVHYTADPVLGEGVADPMPVRSGLIEGVIDVLQVPAPVASPFAGLDMARADRTPTQWIAELATTQTKWDSLRRAAWAWACAAQVTGAAEAEAFVGFWAKAKASLERNPRPVADWAHAEAEARKGFRDAYARPVEPTDDQRPRHFTLNDDGNAARMIHLHGRDLRYCEARKRWLVWDGSRWQWDATGEIMRRARATVKAMRRASEDVLEGEASQKALKNHALASGQLARLRAMIEIAHSEPGISVVMDQLDAGPWLLHCANGTLDLRTGQLQEHRREDLITKTTGVAYTPGARSELWDRVLQTATGGDLELASYLQRIAGYGLLGLATEKAFFFLYGPADTSKSTILDALAAGYGGYAISAAFDTWLQRPGHSVGNNRGDLVRLAGARLVISSEVRPGARFDEENIKRVTGGDPIVADAKYEATVEFRPQCTLIMAANDAPKIRDDDSGMWSRIRRIPLTAVIPKAQQDRALKIKLREPEHATAILAWCVEGLGKYLAQGLGSCAAVEVSTQEYQADQDTFAVFLEECLEPGADGRITRRALREAFRGWIKDSGRSYAIDDRELSKRMREAGAGAASIRGVRHWAGYRLRPVLPDHAAAIDGGMSVADMWQQPTPSKGQVPS